MKNKIGNIKQEYLKEGDIVFSEFLRSKILEGIELTKEEIQELLEWSGDDEYITAEEILEEFGKCTWCNNTFYKEELQEEVNLGCLCPRCKDAIWSRGEKLTFVNKL